jgi:hypothetical protein
MIFEIHRMGVIASFASNSSGGYFYLPVSIAKLFSGKPPASNGERRG